MKKILVALLVAMLALIATAALAETAPHDHDWDWYAVDKDKWDCDTGYTAVANCKVCGEQKSETYDPKGHDFTVPVTWVQEDTCDQAGIATYKCSRCKETTNKTIDKITDHKWELKGYNDVLPTCEEAGYHYYVCTNVINDNKGTHTCGQVWKDPIEALGHEWGEWSVHVAPTCTTKGVDQRACTTCWEFEFKDVAAKGHDIVESSVTTDEKGKVIGICNTCKKWVAVDGTVAPEVKPEDKPSTDKEETKPSKPATKPSTPNKPTTNKDGVTIPATGETMNVAPFIMMLVAIVGLAVTKQKVTE